MKRPLAVLCTLAITSPSAFAGSGDRWDAGTMAWQAGGGALGGFAGAGLFGLAGYYLTSGPNDSWSGLAGLVVGGALGGATGVVAGVDLAGNLDGGTGHWWGTLIGAVDGIAMTAALVHLTTDSRSAAAKYVALIGGTILLLAPPIIGYQLSGDAHAAPTARVLPLAALRF